MNLSVEDRKILLTIARQSIDAAVTHKPPAHVDEARLNSEVLQSHAGAFVTIEMDGHLRGCVGFLRGESALYHTVKEAAISAALHDTRFLPLSEAELNVIELEISVLSPMRRIYDVKEIEVGKHGLLLESGMYHGLLLPQVATEYQWNAKTFLEQTCVKAGLPKNAWEWKETELFVFSAEVFNEKNLIP
jgi:AmmeMemoRadiSam system protein A